MVDRLDGQVRVVPERHSAQDGVDRVQAAGDLSPVDVDLSGRARLVVLSMLSMLGLASFAGISGGTALAAPTAHHAAHAAVTVGPVRGKHRLPRPDIVGGIPGANFSSTNWDGYVATVRYWFTEDGTAPMAYSCDYAILGCSNVSGTIATVTPVTGADYYLQLSFGSGAGTIGPNGNTGTIQGRLYQTNFANMTQTNDYSFNANDTSFTVNPAITVYYNGTLIGGIEP